MPSLTLHLWCPHCPGLCICSHCSLDHSLVDSSKMTRGITDSLDCSRFGLFLRQALWLNCVRPCYFQRRFLHCQITFLLETPSEWTFCRKHSRTSPCQVHSYTSNVLFPTCPSSPDSVACVASVSGWFGSKELQREKWSE